MKTVWQILSKVYRYSDDSNIIFEGTEEKAREKWINNGYKNADHFGLYKVIYELQDGLDTLRGENDGA